MINCYVTEERGKAVMWIKYQCFVSSTFEDLKEERIPFDETKVEHHIKYKTNYFVEYDRFFHEYVFSEFCKQFSLVATLEDRRTKKINREYMLKSSVFTLHKEQDYTSKNMLFHEKNGVTFNSVDLMVPGNGYILTLGSAPKNSIQKKV